jgi:hypothetical protein
MGKTDSSDMRIPHNFIRVTAVPNIKLLTHIFFENFFDESMNVNLEDDSIRR